ncbi:hypothetical protein [Falsiroseomonas oryzae]|uniref:hypothetical protein n=1 Tax=Falsiroseomonas oryzae TaxID=2766473 RepID=UPI0022EA1FB8|nr:hypothetical protein [Roseomonas sp. MO-31]
MTTTDPTRRVGSPLEAAGAVASLLSLMGGARGAAELREAAAALRDMAGTLERIAARHEAPCPGGAYGPGWLPQRGG